MAKKKDVGQVAIEHVNLKLTGEQFKVLYSAITSINAPAKVTMPVIATMERQLQAQANATLNAQQKEPTPKKPVPNRAARRAAAKKKKVAKKKPAKKKAVKGKRQI